MSGSRAMLSDRTLQYAEDLTRALLGADALYVREQAGKIPPAAPGSTEAAMRERLVVLNMSTTHQPEPFTSYAEARARFTALMQAAEALPEPDRRQYYRQCCQSTIAFTHWREGNLALGDIQVGSEALRNSGIVLIRKG